jgi:hypothetical protein
MAYHEHWIAWGGRTSKSGQEGCFHAMLMVSQYGEDVRRSRVVGRTERTKLRNKPGRNDNDAREHDWVRRG